MSDSDNTAITGASASIVPILLWCSKQAPVSSLNRKSNVAYSPLENLPDMQVSQSTAQKLREFTNQKLVLSRKVVLYSASKEEVVYIYRCVFRPISITCQTCIYVDKSRNLTFVTPQVVGVNAILIYVVSFAVSHAYAWNNYDGLFAKGLLARTLVWIDRE